MYKTDPLLVQKCRTLRRKGFTLGEIIKATRLPKATIYEYVYNIELSPEAQERLRKTKKRIAEENTKKLNKFNRKRRKRIPKPQNWSKELINIVGHFLFDGQILKSGCVYSNRSKSQINCLSELMKKHFNLEPYTRIKKDEVIEIGYYNVNLGEYMKKKATDLLRFIISASQKEKRIFLKAFFDDEGCASWWKNVRRVRGYQHNIKILKLIQKLLKDFNIKSRIEEKGKEIVISGKENLIKFRDKINFSEGIYINPERKNSIWKQKLEKREILEKIIDSYKK